MHGGSQWFPQSEGTGTKPPSAGWGLSLGRVTRSPLPRWRRARRDGPGSPVLMAPLMTAACNWGQEQAARGHRPVSTGSARRQGHGGLRRGQGDVDGW